MKNVLNILVLLFLGCVSATPQPKQPEYNVNVHASTSRSARHSENAPRYQHLDVTIDGRKYELESELGVRGVLMIGDYKAKLVTDERGNNDSDSQQIYEF